MNDPKTLRGYPLPDEENLLIEDQPRLAEAITKIDADMSLAIQKADSALFGVNTLSQNDQLLSEAINTFNGKVQPLETLPEAVNTLGGKVQTLENADGQNVKLTGNQTVEGVKTFSSSPSVPTPDPEDNSGKAANTAFVAAALESKADASHTHSIEEVEGLAEALGARAGATVQRVFRSVSGPVPLTGTIPADNTIPQSNEGTEVLTATITPTKATNKLVVTAEINASELTNVGDSIFAALFRDGGANAVAVGFIGGMNGGGNFLTSGMATIRYEVAAGATAATTFKVRAGNNTGSATLNVTHMNINLGNLISSHLVVSEIESG